MASPGFGGVEMLAERDTADLGINLETLAGYFSALANRNRLELLLALREPQHLDKLRLSPTPSRAGASPLRAISRQAVQNHLDLLMDLRLVKLEVQRSHERRHTQYYQTNYSRLFTMMEELRKILANPPSSVDSANTEDVTPLGNDGWKGPRHPPPHVAIVEGVQRGRTFPLRSSDLTPERGWIIGRNPNVQVHLTHDPYVCTENAEILPEGTGYRLMDMRSSRNGTTLNWERLRRGQSSPLRQGDVIGVGRTLLVFRES